MKLDKFFYKLETVGLASYATNATADIYVNNVVRACGFGSIANYYTLPKTMKCTNLFVQPTVNCSTVANTFCTIWTDRESNVCNNDFGGPIYLYSYNGKTITQQIIGIASHSPDFRPNAPCLDGHKVVHTQTAFFVPWITGVVTVRIKNNCLKIIFLILVFSRRHMHH